MRFIAAGFIPDANLAIFPSRSMLLDIKVGPLILLLTRRLTCHLLNASPPFPPIPWSIPRSLTFLYGTPDALSTPEERVRREMHLESQGIPISPFRSFSTSISTPPPLHLFSLLRTILIMLIPTLTPGIFRKSLVASVFLSVPQLSSAWQPHA